MPPKQKKKKSSRLPLIIISIIVLMIGIGGAGAYFMTQVSSGSSFKDVCVNDTRHYSDLCNNVGMYARSLYTVDPVNSRVYGKITGVSWRRVGSIVSRPGEVKRYAQNNDYYYIICPGASSSSCMLYQHNQVKVQPGR